MEPIFLEVFMKYKFFSILFSFCVIFCLSSCGKNELSGSVEKNTYTTYDIDDEISSSLNDNEIDGSNNFDMGTPPSNLSPMSFFGDWTNLDFGLNDTSLNFHNITFEDLNNAGFVLESEADGILSSMQYFQSYFSLANDNYDYRLVSVMCVNDSSEDVNYSNSTIYAIQLNSVIQNKFVSKAPLLSLMNDISWGSSADEIIAAYGEPTSIVDNDTYVLYTYTDGDYSMVLSVYPGGLGTVEFVKNIDSFIQ